MKCRSDYVSFFVSIFVFVFHSRCSCYAAISGDIDEYIYKIIITIYNAE